MIYISERPEVHKRTNYLQKKSNEQKFESDILTLKEVAKYLQVHPMTVHRWAKKGMIPGAFKLGGVWRFKRDILDGCFEERQQFNKGEINVRSIYIRKLT